MSVCVHAFVCVGGLLKVISELVVCIVFIVVIEKRSVTRKPGIGGFN